MGLLVKATSQSFYPQKRNMVPIPQEAVWTPRPVWTFAKKFHPREFDPNTVQVLANRYISLVLRLKTTEAQSPLPSMCS